MIRKICPCPSIILAIAGPWLCVLGGIYLEKVVIQPLTEYIWLGGNDFDEKQLRFSAQLCYALKSAISTLELYYHTLGSKLWDSIAPNPIFDGFPFIREVGLKKFTYLSRLVPEYPNKLVYKAKFDDDDEHRMVVVKFVTTYNAQAHSILAKHGLAPTLHYAGTNDSQASLYSGHYIIVMDFVEGRPVVDALSERQFNQVVQAIQCLHSNDLVFGDLRPPNVLIVEENVMIIDFDWCGEAGVARYPATLNTALGRR
jgi:Protein kinase domain